MTVGDGSKELRAPDGFGAAASSIAFFPALMGGYAVFCAAWWPFAWGWAGAAAFVLVLIAAAIAIVRGVTQIRHAAGFPKESAPDVDRLDRSMALLNGITHPIWMLGSVVLLVLGQGRWVLPLMVVVIGAHFIPMARILGRRIDYLLGPVAMLGALAAGWLALDPQVSWLVVFAVAGLGGAISTLSYAAYMARSYRTLCAAAGVPFPFAAAADSTTTALTSDTPAA